MQTAANRSRITSRKRRASPSCSKPTIDVIGIAHDDDVTVSFVAVASARPRDRRRSAGRRWQEGAKSPSPGLFPAHSFRTTPSSRTPALSSLRIRRMMRGSPMRCSRKRIKPFLAYRIEKPRDVGVQYIAHFPLIDPDIKRIQRIVLTTFWSEAVAQSEELFLVDLIQQHGRCPLDDLVLKGRNRKRALSSIRLRNISCAGRECAVRSPVVALLCKSSISR